MTAMTMDDIKAMTGDWITASVAARVMKMDPGRLIEYARKGELPFATRISGSRVLISRKSFLAAYEPEEKKPDQMELITAQLRTITMLLLAIAMKVDPNLAEIASIKKEDLQ